MNLDLAAIRAHVLVQRNRPAARTPRHVAGPLRRRLQANALLLRWLYAQMRRNYVVDIDAGSCCHRGRLSRQPLRDRSRWHAAGAAAGRHRGGWKAGNVRRRCIDAVAVAVIGIVRNVADAWPLLRDAVLAADWMYEDGQTLVLVTCQRALLVGIEKVRDRDTHR